MSVARGPSGVNVALVQMRADVDPAVNRKRTAEQVHLAADQGAQIVCLQELYATIIFPPCQLSRSLHLCSFWRLESLQQLAGTQTQDADFIFPTLLMTKSHEITIVNIEDELWTFMKNAEIENRLRVQHTSVLE